MSHQDEPMRDPAFREDEPVGDPAFRRSSTITHEPVIEEERESPLPDPAVATRPVPRAVTLVALASLATAVIAGASAGWEYTIPFALLAALLLGFAMTHWALGRRATAERPAGGAEDAAARDADNPLPHFGFDDETALGASAEQAGAEGQAHADMERGPGRR
jgi:hypothetical protein